MCSFLIFLSLVRFVLCLSNIFGILFKLSLYRTNRGGARTAPCGSSLWILQLRLILPFKRTHACCSSRNEDSHIMYLLFSPFFRVLRSLSRQTVLYAFKKSNRAITDLVVPGNYLFLRHAWCLNIQPFLSQMEYIQADIILCSNTICKADWSKRSDGGLLVFKRVIMLALRQT